MVSIVLAFVSGVQWGRHREPGAGSWGEWKGFSVAAREVR